MVHVVAQTRHARAQLSTVAEVSLSFIVGGRSDCTMPLVIKFPERKHSYAVAPFKVVLCTNNVCPVCCLLVLYTLAGTKKHENMEWQCYICVFSKASYLKQSLPFFLPRIVKD